MDRVLAPGGVQADYNWKMKSSVETMADVSPECESDRAAFMRNVELCELDANTTPTQRHCRHHLTTPPRGKETIRYETICVRPPTRPSAHIYTYTHLHDANQNFAGHRCHKFSQTIGVKSHQRLSRQSLTPTRRLLRRDFTASTPAFVKSLWSISQ